MSDLAILPTKKDEAWRYADADYLSNADINEVTVWRESIVPEGQTICETTHLSESGVTRLRVHVEAGGRYEHFALNSAGSYARLEVEITLGEGAHFEFGAVTIGGGDTTQEFVTRTIHAQPHGTSNQVVRAVQWGKSTGNFLGRIEVVQDAQKTDAGMNFRALLLEKGASANTKPELEIFADDVLCAHGAAIGQMDEAAAYYMAARGIPPEVARKLMVQAFIGDAFAAMQSDEDRDAMMEKALKQLESADL
ncbi:MAG: SufD family Fe-S cluster assembly protein [Marinomonas sp.]